MKTSELYARWLRNGATERSLKHQWVKAALFEFNADPEIGTTPEVLALSEAFERDNRTFEGVPANSTCTSCNPRHDNATANWTVGHRPNWWVCTECQRVLPCGCIIPDEDGHCVECGRKMSAQAIASYRATDAEGGKDMTLKHRPELVPMHLEEKAYAFNGSGTAKASIDLWYLPEPSPHFEVSHVLWTDGENIPTVDDITDTPLGLMIIKGHEALNPKNVASLPTTKKEWAEWERLMDERIREAAEQRAANPTPRLTEDEIWARL